MRLVYGMAVCAFFLFPASSHCQEPDSNQAQQQLQPPEPAVVDTGIGFSYTILESKLGESRFNVSHDTLFFRLYYVDNTCINYTYAFNKEGKSLIVKRVTENPVNCYNNEEQLYAVEGRLIRLPKGKFLFELESVTGENANNLYREVIVVK